MFDLGGGTFDVTIMCIYEGILEVAATRGNSHLGGRDIDNALMRHCMEELKQRGFDLEGDKNA